MRILMVLDLPFPPDPRVENEVRSLATAGHDVAVLSIAPDDRPARDTFEENITVFRYTVPRRVVTAMRALAATWPFTTWFISRAIQRVHRRWSFDVVHVHDLYLAGAGVSAARRLGIRCCVDLHEHWVHVIREYRWSTGFPRRLITGRRRWHWFQDRWLPQADCVVTVSPEMAAEYPRVEDRTIIVPNLVSLDGYGAIAVDPVHYSGDNGVKVVLYVGGLLPNRPIDDAVRAVALVREAGLAVRLDIVGDGVERTRLERLVDELALRDSVRFTGWVPQSRVPAHIAGSTVCIHLLRRSRQNDIASPHKLYQYMLAGKPLVVSDCPAMARAVTEAGAGLVIPDGDVPGLASAIERLLIDPETARVLGTSGRTAVLERFNWTHAVQPLLRWYASLAADPAPDEMRESRE